jgi:BirA family biotin operon repressor/biotin-[acetyl-CoA-carboxylase] ligase
VTDLSIDDIRSRVVGCSVGRDLRYFPVVDSTNRVAADLPPGDWSSGTTVLADFQEAGRGRSGRSWVAPTGTSLMLSVIFRREPEVAPADYVMMVALAARDAIVGATDMDVHLKWPNDLLAHDRKVAGILGESSTQNGIDRVILGVGINVNFGDAAGDILPDTATSLDRATGRTISREELAAGLIRSLDLWYRGLTHRSDDIFDAWAAALDTVGLPVSIQDSGTTWNGIALGVQRDGGLLVETNDGSVRCVYAGDVSVRHPKGYTGQ